ncbi:MAG: hypothetical protein K2H46_06830 [Muribaculaceae bacterium]|nr:hypothetical protein [Muribaculaceae bacterium]
MASPFFISPIPLPLLSSFPLLIPSPPSLSSFPLPLLSPTYSRSARTTEQRSYSSRPVVRAEREYESKVKTA